MAKLKGKVCSRCGRKGLRLTRRCVQCGTVGLCLSSCHPWKAACRECMDRTKVGEIVRLRVGCSADLTEEYGEILERLEGGAARVQWVNRDRPYVHLEKSLVPV